MGLQNGLHQDDAAVLRQALLHPQNDLLDLLICQVAKAEHPYYCVVRVRLPREFLYVLNVFDDGVLILI